MYLNEQNPVDIFLADSSDSTGETGMPGLVPGDITVVFSKANGNFVAGAGTVTAKTGGGNGEFRYTPAAGEQDTQGAWGIRASAAGCFTWRDTHEVILRPHADLGMASGDMDSQLNTIETNIIDAIPTPAENADGLLARNQKGGANGPSQQTVADALASGFLHAVIVNGVLSIYNGDGTVAVTRNVGRATTELEAIISLVP